MRFHNASEVCSTGADEAMPALETRMSIPPNSNRQLGKGVRDGVLVGHVHFNGVHHVAAIASRQSVACRLEPVGTDIGQHDAGAFAQITRGNGRADAAATAGDQRHAPGQAFRLGQALQLGLLELPVLDVEGFLFGEPDIGRDRRGLNA